MQDNEWTDDELAERQATENKHAAFAHRNNDTFGGRMSWTDEELKSRQEMWPYAKVTELYRLARLGLAAEQVGRAVFSRMAHFSLDNHEHLDPFLHHEAWRK